MGDVIRAVPPPLSSIQTGIVLRAINSPQFIYFSIWI